MQSSPAHSSFMFSYLILSWLFSESRTNPAQVHSFAGDISSSCSVFCTISHWMFRYRCSAPRQPVSWRLLFLSNGCHFFFLSTSSALSVYWGSWPLMHWTPELWLLTSVHKGLIQRHFNIAKMHSKSCLLQSWVCSSEFSHLEVGICCLVSGPQRSCTVLSLL